jgi:hypothetical protein
VGFDVGLLLLLAGACCDANTLRMRLPLLSDADSGLAHVRWNILV